MTAFPRKSLFMPPVNPDTLPPGGLEILFEATEEERRLLAERFDLLALDRFDGTVRVKPWRKRGVALEGRFGADVVQACVVTLEPVAAKLDENFTAHFLPAEMMEPDAPGAEREIIVDVEAEDPPEAFENGVLDVSEALAEQLALSLDPYPRKQGAHFEAEAEESAPDEEEKRPNPFQLLEKLKKKE